MVVSKRWKTSNKSVYNVAYHIIWCPKYRRKILEGEIENRLKELINERAKEIDVKIERMEVMPDHIHLFVKTTPANAPHWIIQQLKGYTSSILRKEFKKIRTRLPSLWTRSYYIETIGHISQPTIEKYIEDQKKQ